MKKFVLIFILLFSLSSCWEVTPREWGYLDNTQTNNELKDLLEKYNFVKDVDWGMDLCNISEDIKDSYLKLKDWVNYKKWYSIYEKNCARYKIF